MTVEAGRRERRGHPMERRRFERDHSAAGREAALLFAAALAVLVLVAAVSIRQATAPGSAIGVIEDGVAATTEIDLLLDQHLATLQEQARKDQDQTYALPGFPIEVFLTGEELLELDQAGVRDLLLRRSAHSVYDQGLKPFDRTGNQQVSFLSLQGQMDLVLGNLTGTRHSQAGMVALVAGLAFAGAAVGVLLFAEGFSGFRKLGLAVAGGAGLGLLLSGLAWFAAGLPGGNDPFVTELRDILRSLLGVPIRDYGVVLIAGLLVAALTPLASLLATSAETTPVGDPGHETAGEEDWESGAHA
ncbi:MAG: hypothetical protein HUU14_05180 [Dehalococcoidia bacterium]|nr:hypothetical protein [Dehalococcoidia bacterium]NUQ55260.1 hypothetical protein [Dehalococcoidia bacterium]